ncbi:MAG: Isocitrate dehydrogenase [NADP]; Monomeric isocitrate dehydrogenase [NADP], partial [uncultured Frankineae bacterium]
DRRHEDHLHLHRRGPGAGDPLAAAGAAGLRRQGGGGRRDPRHLPRRAHPRGVRAGRRRAGRARRPGEDARRQHHQAAQRQRLHPAAQGRHQGAAERRLRRPRLPGDAADRRGEAGADRLRLGQGQRRQPGAARGQLRPPRARLGEELRQEAPPRDGRLVPGHPVARRDDDRRRLPALGDVRDAAGRHDPAHRARRRRRRDDGAEGRPAGAGGGDRRRRRHARHGAERLSRPRDPGRAGAGGAVLRAPQGHDDEGLRPDHLRARREGLLRRRLRAVRRRPRPRRRRPQPGAGRRAVRPGGPARGPAQGDHGRHRRGVRAGSGAGAGRLEPRHHQPARPERRHHRRLHARGDPQLRADVERAGPAAGHQVRHPRLVLRGALRRDGPGLPRARRLRPDDHGHDAQRRSDGAEGRGVRQSRQDLRDPGSGHRAGRGRRGHGPARAAGRRGRHLPRLPDQGRADQGLGAAGGPAGPRDRRTRGLLARRDPRPRRRGAEEGPGVPRGGGPGHERRRRADDRGDGRRRGHPLHPGPGPSRRGHHLGDGQRPARLPDRPVPHPRARHQRQDAVHRAAHERRRAVRDRSRRLGPQARAAAGEGELPALGLARRVPRAGGVVRVPGREDGQRARRAARGDPRRGDRPGARGGPLARAQGRPAGQPRQPLLPGAVLGAGPGPADAGRRRGRAVRRSRRAPRRRRVDDRRRAERRAGLARGPRRLLLRRQGQDRRGHAAERDLQPGARRVL